MGIAATRLAALTAVSLVVLPATGASAKPRRDVTPPAVSISSPVAGARVWGTTKIAATATDNIGVKRVDFYVDGALRGSDAAAPFEYAWDTRALASAARPALTAKAYDAAGNYATSPPVTVEVSRRVPLGAAVGWSRLNGDLAYRNAFLKTYGSLTPETEMKWYLTEPQDGVFDFTASD